MDTEDIMFHIIVFQKIHEKNTLHHILYSNKFIPRQNAENAFQGSLFLSHTKENKLKRTSDTRSSVAWHTKWKEETRGRSINKIYRDTSNFAR